MEAPTAPPVPPTSLPTGSEGAACSSAPRLSSRVRERHQPSRSTKEQAERLSRSACFRLRYLSHPLREAFLQKSSRSPREAEPRPDLKDAGVVLPHNGSTYRPGFLGTVSSVSMNASKRAAPA